MTDVPRSLVPSASSSRPLVWTGLKISVYDAMMILGLSRDSVQDMINNGTLIAWRPNPRGRKQLLWESQVQQIAADQERKAAERARILSAQLRLELF